MSMRPKSADKQNNLHKFNPTYTENFLVNKTICEFHILFVPKKLEIILDWKILTKLSLLQKQLKYKHKIACHIGYSVG